MTVVGDLYHRKAVASISYGHHRIRCTRTHSIPSRMFPGASTSAGRPRGKGHQQRGGGHGIGEPVPRRDGWRGRGWTASKQRERRRVGFQVVVIGLSRRQWRIFHRFFSPRFSLGVIYTPYIRSFFCRVSCHSSMYIKHVKVVITVNVMLSL